MKLLDVLNKDFNKADVKEFLCYSIKHPASIKGINRKKEKLSYLQNIIKKNVSVDEENLKIKKLSYIKLKSVDEQKKALCDLEKEVHLAGIDISLNYEHIDWKMEFDDSEDMAAYHRFMWLYRDMFDNLNISNCDEYNRRIIQIIHSWIDNVGNVARENMHPEVWQTYTVSERLTNWMFLIGLTSKDDCSDQKIITSVIRQMKYIQDNLEYYGEKLTGNHLGNDGKGLYIAGRMLGIDYFSELGKRILMNEFNRVIVDDCFLREGSVHYQFLYTKWYADLLWISIETGDEEFEGVLRERLEKLVRGCEFFLYGKGYNSWTIPLFGDISPDHSPKWIMGVPWVANAFLGNKMKGSCPVSKGYHTFFQQLIEGRETELSTKLDSGITNDWARLVEGDTVVFGRVFSTLYPNNAPGHFHHDTGSFTLSYKGLPIIVDAGRCKYGDDGKSKNQRDHYGHNQFVVDYKNPEIDMRMFYTKAFLEDYLGNKPELTIDNNKMTMSCFGGKRINGLMEHRRYITVDNDMVSIVDSACGTGTHNIEFVLHLPIDFSVQKVGNGVICSAAELSCCVTFDVLPDYFLINNEVEKEVYCNYSREYGEETYCNVIVFGKQVEFPFELQTRIKIME